MSVTRDNLRALINQFVRNYAVTAFLDMKLNMILNMMIDWIDSGGTTGPIVVVPGLYPITSADFINATDCPITALNGYNLQIYWNESNRFLIKADGEWTDLAGGGFRVLISGFDSTTATFHFYIYTS